MKRFVVLTLGDLTQCTFNMIIIDDHTDSGNAKRMREKRTVVGQFLVPSLPQDHC